MQEEYPQNARGVDEFQQRLSTARAGGQIPSAAPVVFQAGAKNLALACDLIPNCAEIVDNSFCMEGSWRRRGYAVRTRPLLFWIDAADAGRASEWHSKGIPREKGLPSLFSKWEKWCIMALQAGPPPGCGKRQKTLGCAGDTAAKLPVHCGRLMIKEEETMTKILTGGPLPNIPWEDKPASVVNAPGLALQRQPRHRPQPRKGRGAHLQQRRGALWGRLCRGSARRAGQRHPAHLHGLFPRRHPLEDRRKQDPLCGRRGQALHAGLRLRPAPGQGRGHLLHHVVHGLLRRGHRPCAHEGLQDLCPHGESLHSL